MVVKLDVDDAFIINDGETDIVKDDKFIMDSGAQLHICNNQKFYTSLEDLQEPIKVNGLGSVLIRQAGSIQVPFLVDGKTVIRAFSNVYFAPFLRHSLISMGILQDEGYSITVTDHKPGQPTLWTFSKGREVQMCGALDNNLVIALRHTTPVALPGVIDGKPFSTWKPDTFDRWHRKLGHLSSSSLEKLAALGLPIQGEHKLSVCEACHLGKDHRRPFPKASSTRATAQLERIHADLCGPFPVQSLGGFRYFATITDDFSGHVEVVFLRHKDQYFTKFKEYHQFWSKHLQLPMKFFRHDGGGEFMSNEFTIYLKENGIQREPTTPYTPQQNGKSERMNRTLMDKARSFMFQSGVPLNLWAEAVNQAAVVRNVSPYTPNDGATPNSLWNPSGRTELELHTFGCLCFAKNPAKLPKLAPRSHRCIYLGPDPERKAHRLYSIADRKVISASINSVDFHEDIFPFASQRPSNEELRQFDEAIPEDDDKDDDEPTLLSPVQPARPASPSVDPAVDNEDSPPPLEPIDPVQPVVPLPVRPEGEQQQQQNPAVPVTHPVPVPAPAPQLSADPNVPAQESHGPEPHRRQSQRSNFGVKPGEFWKAGYKPSYPIERFDKPPAAPFQGLIETYATAGYSTSPPLVFPVWLPPPGSSPEAQAFAASLPPEPRFLQEALSGPEAAQWRAAVEEEYNTLLKKQTWDLTPLPPGRKLIATTWVFKRKIGPDGKVERYKARLCAKGFTQIQGLDYDQTFSPVAQYRSLRILLALATMYDLDLHQLDVTSAFLNGKIDHDLYMSQPQGFNDGSGKVCKLVKAIYGLKQASRCWNAEVHATLLRLGFKQLHGDPCLYVLRQGDSIIILFLYVDDMGIASNSPELRMHIIKSLQAEYEIKDQGELNWILGMKVTRDRPSRTLRLDQSQYITSVLSKFGMDQCKTVSTPALPGTQVTKADCPTTDEQKQEMVAVPYKSLAGSLLHAVNGTRPDICFATNILCRYMSNPGPAHWSAGKRILRYLAGTSSLGLQFSAQPSDSPRLCGFSDADWGSDPDHRHSTTGYVFFMAGAPISWATKRQPTVALSSMEAEYMAATAACQEALSLRSLLQEIGLSQVTVPVYIDNQGAIFQAQNSVVNARSKHIDIKHHFVRECLEQGHVDAKWIPTKDQIADILTKSLPTTLFKQFRGLLLH